MGRSATRLHGAREVTVERGERDGDGDEALCSHWREDVDVARHQRGLGDECDRVIVRGEHFENAARDLQILLDRLVDIRVASQHDAAWLVGLLRKLARKQGGGRRLHENLGLEVEARRQAAIRVIGAREAVDAAVFAALVGVDRPIEGNVGRGVVGYDGLGLLEDGFRLQGRELILCRPTVIERLGVLLLEPARGVRQGATPARLIPHFGPVGRLRSRLPFFLRRHF